MMTSGRSSPRILATRRLGKIDEYNAHRLAFIDSVEPVMRHFYQYVSCRPSAPYWWSSSLLVIRCKMHYFTKDSRSFAIVAVSEIGRSSDSIDSGGWTFGSELA